MKTIKDLTKECHLNAKTAGWWYDEKSNLNLIRVLSTPFNATEELIAKLLVPTKLCLSHSELSEAMEGYRKGLMDDKLPHRSMLEVELADTIIRILDLAGALNLDVAGAIEEKLEYNKTREDHKLENRNQSGGKAF